MTKTSYNYTIEMTREERTERKEYAKCSIIFTVLAVLTILVNVLWCIFYPVATTGEAALIDGDFKFGVFLFLLLLTAFWAMCNRVALRRAIY